MSTLIDWLNTPNRSFTPLTPWGGFTSLGVSSGAVWDKAKTKQLQYLSWFIFSILCPWLPGGNSPSELPLRALKVRKLELGKGKVRKIDLWNARKLEDRNWKSVGLES